ncbi:hypothetical protein Trco_002709 [Trichoderma cornu-damae]|uniref:Uncharacterized protein n=1 Tax=Trichoderma cornu-damae TaxID=654480 RepID=A0A9P8QU66_9HYPO|nr:hypothetical protein Trco_002709 [Trichoderma cornu-damae]
MASSPKSPNGEDRRPVYGTKEDVKGELDSERPRLARTKTPEPLAEQQNGRLTPNIPAVLGPFDWDDFEARYEKALVEADEQERDILKEAENLSKYFQVWASAASAHDDERAVKRLQTRQRFVNISEEKMAQKQQHYEEVVRAFETQRLPVRMATDEPPFKIPQITSHEILEFHQSHFSSEAIAEFGQHFTNLPAHGTSEDQLYEEWGEEGEEEEDDGLGYYEDGVKRTLTDEQVEIFRHSELRELRRQQEKQTQANSVTPRDVPANETDAAFPQESSIPASSRSKKKKKNKKSKVVQQEPKPDLRKRTWDVVEAGLDSLDYD